jgi:anti-sigma-K factor RskA
MTEIDIHALAGAYVLDAVDDVERAAFTRHLAECSSCATEVDEMREVAARLADSTWSVPPPRLRAEVLAAVSRTRQLPPGAPVAPERDTVAVVSRWRRFTAGAAAAGILAVGAGAATYAIQEQRVREQSAIAVQAQQERARTQAILTAPDVQVRTTTMSGGGRLTVASSARERAGVVLVAAGIAPASDQALQLWTLRGTTPTEAGLLDPGTSSGVRIVEGLPGSTAFAVTLEPAGGSRTPTLPPVGAVTLT